MRGFIIAAAAVVVDVVVNTAVPLFRRVNYAQTGDCRVCVCVYQ